MEKALPSCDSTKGVSVEASFTPVEPFEAFDIGATVDPSYWWHGAQGDQATSGGGAREALS